MVRFSLARGECLTFTLSLEWSAANIAVSDISLKTWSFDLHFCCRKYRYIFNQFYIIRPKATEFSEITLRLRYYAVQGHLRSPSLVPIESSYATSYEEAHMRLPIRKSHMSKFLLVINSNVPLIFHCFRDIALERSKIVIFWLPLLRLTPDGRVLLQGRFPWKFYPKVRDGQGTKWRRNIAENFNRLSRVHERYRHTYDIRQTDRQQTDGRWQLDKFTFAKNYSLAAGLLSKSNKTCDKQCSSDHVVCMFMIIKFVSVI